MTFSKQGFGLWTNIGLGMLGALLGGFLFRLLGIDFGLGEIKITLEGLISAFVGSLFCILAWWLMRKGVGQKSSALKRCVALRRINTLRFMQLFLNALVSSTVIRIF